MKKSLERQILEEVWSDFEIWILEHRYSSEVGWRRDPWMRGISERIKQESA